MESSNFNELYDQASMEVMTAAEEACVRGSNRLEEIRNYAKTAGVKRIGIAHCVSMPKEAAAVGQFPSGIVLKYMKRNALFCRTYFLENLRDGRLF